MIQTLTYLAIGLGVLIGIVLAVGTFSFVMHNYVDPALHRFGKKYPKVSVWISGIIVGSSLLFIVYYLGRMVKGNL